MNAINPKLLADLAKLARRYPVEDWLTLTRVLNDPVTRREITQLLDELAAASARQSQKTAGHSRTAKRASVRQLIDGHRSLDPSKARLLEEVWGQLQQRELFPDVGTIRAFAEATGLKDFQSTRRDQAVTILMRHLADLPKAELNAALAQPREGVSRSGEYERWVQLIVGSDAEKPHVEG